MKSASGKFVIRIPSKLHQELKDEAIRLNKSLNEYCLDILSNRYWQNINKEIKLLISKFKKNLVGVVLFGSKSRGDYHDNSDTDLLVVLDPTISINRELYQLSLGVCFQMGKDGHLETDP